MDTRRALALRRSSHNHWIFRIIVLVGVLFFVFYAINFYRTHEKVTTGMTYMPKPEHQERYSAARLYLERQGKQTAFFEGLGEWDKLQALLADTEHAQGKVLLMRGFNEGQATQIDDLMAWTKAGGHLIWMENESWLAPWATDSGDESSEYKRQDITTANPIYKPLGVSLVPVKEPDERTIDDTHHQVLAYAPSGEYFVLDIFSDRSLLRSAHKRYHDFAPFGGRVPSLSELEQLFGEADRGDLETIATLWREDPDRFDVSLEILDLAVENGRVTILRSNEIFDNPHPTGRGSEMWESQCQDERTETDLEPTLWRVFKVDGKGFRCSPDSRTAYGHGLMGYDNAYLLTELTRDSHTVYFVSQIERDDLLALMTKHTKSLLFGVLMALCACLLALPRQFGRKLSYEAYHSHDVLGFFERIGQYLWATDRAMHLVNDNRAQLIEQIRAQHPSTVRMNQGDQIAYLARLTRLDQKLIDTALYKDYQTQGQFVEVSQAFYQLSQALKLTNILGR